MRQILLIALILFASHSCLAAELNGRVVHVIDGDTLEVLASNSKTVRVRLSGIDAPEWNQPFGSKAKRHLLERVANRRVVVSWDKIDKYGRTVGKVLVDGEDANLQMIRDGYAWWFRWFSREQTPADRERYEAAESEAKGARRGLWRDADPVAPWDWRRR